MNEFTENDLVIVIGDPQTDLKGFGAIIVKKPEKKESGDWVIALIEIQPHFHAALTGTRVVVRESEIQHARLQFVPC